MSDVELRLDEVVGGICLRAEAVDGCRATDVILAFDLAERRLPGLLLLTNSSERLVNRGWNVVAVGLPAPSMTISFEPSNCVSFVSQCLKYASC